jgi:environmental stress-induced protein Ves
VTGDAVASVLRASDRVSVPWRNGSGTTTVVAASSDPVDRGAAAEPRWRVSIATISEAADFSLFPGVDRVLMPLSPGGLTLAIAGGIRRLAQYEAVSFAGEEEVASVDVESTGLDLNLMTRRGKGDGSLGLTRLAGAQSFSAADGETTVVIVLDGDVSGAGGPLLNHDALLLPSGAAVELIGHGALAVVRVSRRGAPSGRPPPAVIQEERPADATIHAASLSSWIRHVRRRWSRYAGSFLARYSTGAEPTPRVSRFR